MSDQPLDKTNLLGLFNSYIEQAEDQIESDGFLPGLDVTNRAATELLNDIIEFGLAVERVNDDAYEGAKVTYRETK